MKKIILTLSIFLVISLSYSQSSFTPQLRKFSLLNPNKLSVNHSVSFMSGFSSNNNAFYHSQYTNHIQYRFNPKLTLNLDLNFVNMGTAKFSDNFNIEGNNDNNSKVLPEFSLNYRPTENMNIKIEFRQGNVYHLRNNPFRRW